MKRGDLVPPGEFRFFIDMGSDEPSATIIIVDNRTDEDCTDHEPDDMRRLFGLQRAYTPTAMALSPLDIIKLIRSQG